MLWAVFCVLLYIMDVLVIREAEVRLAERFPEIVPPPFFVRGYLEVPEKFLKEAVLWTTAPDSESRVASSITKLLRLPNSSQPTLTFESDLDLTLSVSRAF